MEPGKKALEPQLGLEFQAIPADQVTFVSFCGAQPGLSEKNTQGDAEGRQQRGGYLNTRAPSRRPKEMKSLLGLRGLSPLHSNRPSLAVVLNLMKAFDLDPETLEEIHNFTKQTILHQHAFRRLWGSFSCQLQEASPKDNLAYFSFLLKF